MKFRILPLLAAVAALVLPACQQNKNGDAFGPGFNNPDGGAFDSGGYGSSLPQRDESVSFYGPGVDRSMFPPVYFDFDSFDIRSDQYGVITQVADHLRRSRSRLIIAGHTDASGTSEYNRALGERRAQAVRNALASQGADAGAIQTLSFGEDSPADAGNDAANRRAEFGVVRK
jgi:peptidoglycan-associated lipoprotein